MIRKITYAFFGILFFVLMALSAFAIYPTRPSGHIENYADYFVDDHSGVGNDQVKVTFFGVSTLLFDDGETQILIDGFFLRHSLIRTLFSKIESDHDAINQLVNKFKMDRVKGIFVIHSHYNHAFDVAYVAQKTGAKLFGSRSTLNIARVGNLKENQMELFPLNHAVEMGKFFITILPSIHSPGNALEDDGIEITAPISQPAKFDRYPEGGCYDFLIKHADHSIYVKPSPNYIEAALDTFHVDALFLGIGILNKQPEEWQQNFYRNTVGSLKPSIVIPLHWDNFFYPVDDHLVMLSRFATEAAKDFDFMIMKTKADNIHFKILQGTKSIILF